MTAREKFQVGDRIRLTALGATRHLRLVEGWPGTVVGFGKAPDQVAVIPDQRRNRRLHHMDWWTRMVIPPQEDVR